MTWTATGRAKLPDPYPTLAQPRLRSGPPVGLPGSALAAHYRWVDDALRHRADGYRLLDLAPVGLPGVEHLARQRLRRSAFADVHAALAGAVSLTVTDRFTSSPRANVTSGTSLSVRLIVVSW